MFTFTYMCIHCFGHLLTPPTPCFFLHCLNDRPSILSKVDLFFIKSLCLFPTQDLSKAINILCTYYFICVLGIEFRALCILGKQVLYHLNYACSPENSII
jgi:hypothetical protein